MKKSENTTMQKTKVTNTQYRDADTYGGAETQKSKGVDTYTTGNANTSKTGDTNI